VKKRKCKRRAGGTEESASETIKDRSTLPFSEYRKRGQTTFFQKKKADLD